MGEPVTPANRKRLPIDVWVSDRRMPDVSGLVASVAEYAAGYDRAMQRRDFAARVEASWGLVARGEDALRWCLERLRSGDPEAVSDACGVLAWLGTPRRFWPVLRRLLRELPDGEARDAVDEALPEGARGDIDAVAGEQPPSEELFGGAMAPFTSIVYYVEAPLDAVMAARRRWNAGIRFPEKHRSLRGPLAELLTRLEPWAMPSWKSLYTRTTGGWTAVFSQGSDLSSVDHDASLLRTRVLRTAHSPDIKVRGRMVSYGSTAFWLCDGTREDLAPLHGLRSIQASRQSGWSWVEHGEVQPFEETERYGARRIADRFDLPMLNRYCAALGIDRANAAFHGPDAVLVEIVRRRRTRPPRSMSSAEWRARHRPSTEAEAGSTTEAGAEPA